MGKLFSRLSCFQIIAIELEVVLPCFISARTLKTLSIPDVVVYCRDIRNRINFVTRSEIFTHIWFKNVIFKMNFEAVSCMWNCDAVLRNVLVLDSLIQYLFIQKLQVDTATTLNMCGPINVNTCSYRDRKFRLSFSNRLNPQACDLRLYLCNLWRGSGRYHLDTWYGSEITTLTRCGCFVNGHWPVIIIIAICLI